MSNLYTGAYIFRIAVPLLNCGDVLCSGVYFDVTVALALVCLGFHDIGFNIYINPTYIIIFEESFL